MMSNSKIREGNYVEFLPSGKLSFEKRWKLIDNAQETIHLVTFSFMNDETTHRLVNKLLEKLRRGVEVKIILDQIVNKTTFVGKLLKRLEKNGAELHQYNPLGQGWRIHWEEGHPFKQLMRNAKLKLKQHFHEKYMVIDGEEVILGGINWGDKYAYGGIREEAWRDSDVYLKGPVVRDIQIQFLKDFYRYKLWERTVREKPRSRYYEFVKTIKWINSGFVEEQFPGYLKNNKPCGTASVAYMAHKPYDDEELPLTNKFLELIASAKEHIFWGCHGIRPPRIYGYYLAEAVKRGVEVHLITCSKKSSKSLMLNGLFGWMYWECTKHFRYLLENGIHIYEWQPKGAFHSKNLLIDNTVCSIGSYNIARGSTYHHSESNVLIYDPEIIRQVEAQFYIDLKDCREVILSEIKHKLPARNAFDRVLHERDLMIDKELIPEEIFNELLRKNYKRILT
ncbi:phosphatidylserine/phosphatidylglycerophosphate/cardiolipin synthase-like enzyme [Marinilabilia salmonicolor]|uniref:phospholipase D-like domain-containing protein n=1 Tax=Marinilabilia salmonicolor TaxID=989 RepID=UPI000D07DF91|nr:phosphatidylserine/phosphatidylglycerophosphate/cardiolipin synthase family protein [Marinilabilia salmonicolor]PRZ01828.1 phosphatidylserine/phosphatidylglycerophosphate/cardiolipin synthase-like enzyme [Marinilabilia salmonicolor]